MNPKTRLAIWLGTKKRNYPEGFSIYKDLAVNPKRNSFLNKPVPGGVEKNMLLNDLLRYARIHNIKPKNPDEIQQEQQAGDAAFAQLVKKQQPKIHPQTIPDTLIEKHRVEIIKNPKINYNELPDELKSVYDTFRGLYESYDLKRAELGNYPPTPDKNENRKKLATEIVDLKKQIRKNWDLIDTWWANREKEPEQTESNIEPSGRLNKAEIEQLSDEGVKALSKKLRIEANLKYISRNQNSGSAKTIEKVAERKRELDEWDVNYAELLKKDS